MRNILTILIVVLFSGCLCPNCPACDTPMVDTVVIHDTVRVHDTVVKHKIKYSRDSSVMSINQSGGVTANEVINNY